MIFWDAEIKSADTDWRFLTPFDYRNVVGSACGGVRLADWSLEEFDTLDLRGPVPGVLRYTVKPGSIVVGVSAVLLVDVIQAGDLHHPYIDKTTGYTVQLGAWNNFPSGSDVMLYVDPGITESCVFEVGYGYSWDETEHAWLPITGFGVQFPGAFGRSAFLRLTNTTGYDQVMCKLVWANDGSTMGLWRAKMQSGDWAVDGTNELVFNADGCVSGHVPPGASTIIEIQPLVQEGTTAIDNPVVGLFEVQSVSI
jgi:hypothetical protein